MYAWYVCGFVVLKTYWRWCEGYVCDGCGVALARRRVCIRRVVRRRMMGLDGRATRGIRGDARETSIARTCARGASSFSVRGGKEGCARRFASIRVDSIRFDSAPFDSIRFDSIHSFVRRRWIGLDWIGFDDAGRWVDDVLVDVRVRVRDGERYDGGGTRDAETCAARVSRAPRAREDRRRRRR